MSNLNKRIDPQTLTDAISNAIVNVAKPKSEELFDGLAPEQIAANLCTAFNSFDGLSTGKKAAYHDDWVAFVYIIWYLPERIHSAYRIFHTTCQLKLAEGLGPAAFNLVDLGAGTLAGQMGLALHLADIRLCWVPISKYPLPEIAVISLDESESMMEIGQRVWEQFSHEVCERRHNKLHALDSVCRVIESRPLPVDRSRPDKSLSNIDITPDAMVVVSALHAVYKDDPTLGSFLGQLVEKTGAGIVLLSCHNDGTSKNRTKSAFTDNRVSSGYLEMDLGTVPIKLQGVLDPVTEFRRDLFHRSIEPYKASLSQQNYGLLQQRLTHIPTGWGVDDVAFFKFEKL